MILLIVTLCKALKFEHLLDFTIIAFKPSIERSKLHENRLNIRYT
jgi:hypothetical protein